MLNMPLTFILTKLNEIKITGLKHYARIKGLQMWEKIPTPNYSDIMCDFHSLNYMIWINFSWLWDQVKYHICEKLWIQINLHDACLGLVNNRLTYCISSHLANLSCFGYRYFNRLAWRNLYEPQTRQNWNVFLNRRKKKVKIASKYV